jgi:hypothetical protein
LRVRERADEEGVAGMRAGLAGLVVGLRSEGRAVPVPFDSFSVRLCPFDSFSVRLCPN